MNMDRRSCTASSELEGGGAEMDSLWLPPGFRFHPTDEELILHYLHHKVQDESFNQGAIRGDVDLNKCEPWNLPGELKVVGGGEEEWYLYSKRDKKYPTGMRTNRATEAGYWKATGNDRLIVSSNPRLQLIGMRKTLVFYQGRAPHGHKTHWVMHEYRLEGPAFTHIPNESKEKWAVCRVFCKQGGQYSNKIPCKDFNDDESPMHKAHENMINNATSNHIQQSPCPPSSMEIEDIVTTSPSSYDHKEYFDMFNIVGDSLAFSLEPNNL